MTAVAPPLVLVVVLVVVQVLFDIEVYWHRRGRRNSHRLRTAHGARSLFVHVRPTGSRWVLRRLRTAATLFVSSVPYNIISTSSLFIAVTHHQSPNTIDGRARVSSTRHLHRRATISISAAVVTMPPLTLLPLPLAWSSCVRGRARVFVVHVFPGKDVYGHRRPKMICYMPRIQVKERLIKFRIEGKKKKNSKT